MIDFVISQAVCPTLTWAELNGYITQNHYYQLVAIKTGKISRPLKLQLTYVHGLLADIYCGMKCKQFRGQLGKNIFHDSSQEVSLNWGLKFTIAYYWLKNAHQKLQRLLTPMLQTITTVMERKGPTIPVTLTVRWWCAGAYYPASEQVSRAWSQDTDGILSVNQEETVGDCKEETTFPAQTFRCWPAKKFWNSLCLATTGAVAPPLKLSRVSLGRNLSLKNSPWHNWKLGFGTLMNYDYI